MDGCQDASCAAENTLLDSYDILANHTVWAAIALGYPLSDGAKMQKRDDVVRYV